jgi:hypothetical protein
MSEYTCNGCKIVFGACPNEVIDHCFTIGMGKGTRIAFEFRKTNLCPCYECLVKIMCQDPIRCNMRNKYSRNASKYVTRKLLKI